MLNLIDFHPDSVLSDLSLLIVNISGLLIVTSQELPFAVPLTY